MEQLALQVRSFVYAMICFQCLLQLSTGKTFYKYLKFFSQLLSVCIFCNIFFSFIGIVDDGWEQADRIYKQWQEQWNSEEVLTVSENYLENQIVEDSVEEFKEQITRILESEGRGAYEIVEIVQHEDVWEIMLTETMQQQDDNFINSFKQVICNKFSLAENQVEVTLQ